jgi:hypothetical protein
VGVNNNPPIQIHPEIDKSTMVAYINENFRKISDGFNPLIISDGRKDRLAIGRDKTGNYGVTYYNANGNISAKSDGGTDFKYDNDGINYYQAGLLPDGTYGIIITKPGIDISTVY